MQEDSVRVKFDGEISGVDINTFARVLLDYSTVVRESSQEIDPSVSLSVKITGAEPGCLEAYLQLIPTIGKGLLDSFKVIAPELPEIVHTTSELYKFMHQISKKGGVKSSSQEGKAINVVTGDGSTVNVSQDTYNIYLRDGEAPAAVRKTFEALSHESGISMVSFGPRSKSDETVSIPSSDFTALANTPIAPSKKREGIFADQTLTIVRAMFVESKKRKWLFQWKDSTISAPITDDTFFERFPEMSFKLGDALLADLKIEQRLDSKTGLYLCESYEVVKVHSKVESPSMEQLDI